MKTNKLPKRPRGSVLNSRIPRKIKKVIKKHLCEHLNSLQLKTHHIRVFAAQVRGKFWHLGGADICKRKYPEIDMKEASFLYCAMRTFDIKV